MKSKKIMIRDDDQGIVEMLELFLDLEGYQVLSEKTVQIWPNSS